MFLIRHPALSWKKLKQLMNRRNKNGKNGNKRIFLSEAYNSGV